MRSGRRRGGHEGGHDAGMERWLLTYADMITLLLALFVVLFALSSINVKKFLEFKSGLTSTFNPSAVVLSGDNGLLSQPSLVASANGTREAGTQQDDPGSTTELERIASQIQRALASQHLARDAEVSVSSQAVVVQILADKVFFATDSASLGSAGQRVVDIIAGVVRADPNDVVVDGYTDNEPITGGPYSSNWELSAARAANVVNRLNVSDGIQASRLSAQGFGQTHPEAANTTAADRAKNRRIDVVIKSLGAK